MKTGFQTKVLPFLHTKKGMAITAAAAVLILGGGLSGLAALHNKGRSSSDSSLTNSTLQQVITNDAFFYGQSPPVYPSPNMTGVGTWAVSYNKAVALVNNMTLDERVSLLSGSSSSPNGCSGYISPVDSVGFPGMCLSDAGNGLRSTDFVSSWPSGIHVGASWNRDLAARRASDMAAEFKKKGVNVLLGPVVGPVGRTVRDGRYWEGFSVDPYLAGALVYETVVGTQEANVITSVKHYIANEQETNRQPHNDVESVSANIDDRTMHELYLWPFQDAVYAGSGNIMCSYNRLNNSYGCANSKTMNGLLKTELGFQGFVVSDWSAQHAGVATALAGLDMAMPSADSFWGDHLVDAVNNGSISEYRVTDMATRIIAAWYQMGQDSDFPTPGIGMPSDLTKPHTIVDGRNVSARQTLLDGAVEGHVLLKNENHALPLDAPCLISLFGYSAKAPDQNNYVPGSLPAWGFGAESANETEEQLGFNGDVTSPSAIALNGTLFTGGGSGATSQSLVSAPFDAIQQRAWEDGTAMFWDFGTNDPSVNGASDVCLVLANVWATESYDRPGLQDDYTDDLITNVANKCNNTIVVIHNAGVRVVDAWIEHPNVTALIFAHLPGQASGQALVSILYGESNPSGKLPYTVAKEASDYGSLLDPVKPDGIYAYFPQSNYSEGVYLDYRQFDANDIAPRYEFGFGLSYTTFNFSDLQITKRSTSNDSYSTLFDDYPTGAIRQGGQADLWDELVTVTANVTNTGDVDGAEVAQLYLTIPGEDVPVRQLRGFDKPYLNTTQTATVEFSLTRRDLSIWDTTAQKWLLQEGTYNVSVGSSSRTLPLAGTFTIP